MVLAQTLPLNLIYGGRCTSHQDLSSKVGRNKWEADEGGLGGSQGGLARFTLL